MNNQINFSRHRLVVIIVLSVSLAISTSAFKMADAARASQPSATLDVCPIGCPYTTLQSAVNAAASGDLIRVANGTYSGVTVIDKTVTVLGGYAGPPLWQRDLALYPTILDGGGSGPVITIRSNSSPTIDGFKIVNGSAMRGGGVAIQNSSPTLSRNLIQSNHAIEFGGGIHVIGTTAAPILDRNQITSNTAANGGGIFIDDYSKPLLTNNVIAKNRASSNGGGIYIDFYAQPSIINNTLAVNNLGPSWANEGIYLYNCPSPVIRNNIIATHTSAIELSGTPCALTLEYNDVWECSGNCYSGVSPGTQDQSVDPGFLDSGNGDYHLRCDSPIIDVGTSNGAPTQDLDGDPRPLGNGIEIGADEYNGSVCPTPTPTLTHTPTLTATNTPTNTPTPTTTNTPTLTPTFTTTSTHTNTPTTIPCVSKPRPPQLVSPPKGTTVMTRRPLLDWTDSRCAVFYQAQVYKNSMTGMPILNIRTTKSRFKPPKLDGEGAHYLWRVRACGEKSCGKWTAPWDFFVSPP